MQNRRKYMFCKYMYTTLASFIFKCCSHHLGSCSVGTILSQEEASIATSLWPLQPRPDGKGRKKLNEFQREAIDNALSKDFSMVQGPPGMAITSFYMLYYSQDIIIVVLVYSQEQAKV